MRCEQAMLDEHGWLVDAGLKSCSLGWQSRERSWARRAKREPWDDCHEGRERIRKAPTLDPVGKPCDPRVPKRSGALIAERRSAG